MYENLKTYSLALIALVLVAQTFMMLPSGDGGVADFGGYNAPGDIIPANDLPPPIENVDDFQTNINKSYDDNLPKTSIKFTETSFDFGDVKEGKVVKHTFQFKNTGTNPLIIKNAAGSCGCTIPEWPREAIAPNETGELVVSYNSKGRKGIKTNTVTVVANTDPMASQITIKANVLNDKEPGAPVSDTVGDLIFSQ